MKLNSKVIKALPEDFSKEEFEKRVLANSDLFGHFVTVMRKGLEAHKADQLKTSKYDVANWAYLQADSNGYQRALEEAIQLLNFKD